MIVRLAAIAIVGIFLSGYLPRVLVSGQLSWIVWLLAAFVVFGAPHFIRRSASGLVAYGRKRSGIAR